MSYGIASWSGLMDAVRRADDLEAAQRQFSLVDLYNAGPSLAEQIATHTQMRLANATATHLIRNAIDSALPDFANGAVAEVEREFSAARMNMAFSVTAAHGPRRYLSAARQAERLWDAARISAYALDMSRPPAARRSRTAAGAWTGDDFLHEPQRARLRQQIDLAKAMEVRARFEAADPYDFARTSNLASLAGGLLGSDAWAWLKDTARAARAAPFEPDLARALRTALGDWRDRMAPQPTWIDPEARRALYAERGFDFAFAATLSPVFDRRADHSAEPVRALPQPAPARPDARAAEPADATPPSEDARRRREAFALLETLETELRAFIVARLSSAHGDRWHLTHVPSTIRAAWAERRDRAERDGAEPAPLWSYIDFGDYRQIIETRPNWAGVFKPVFLRVEDVRESLQRLHPVRNATMHFRTITPDDMVLIHFETRRIRRAIAGAEGV